MNEKTIPELLQNRVKEHGTKLLFQRRDGWSWKQITWLDFDRKVKNISSFMMSTGFGKGDRALIASSNRLEAISAEIATFLIGGVIVPLAKDESAEKIITTAIDLNVRFIFIEEGEALYEILNSLDRIPKVKRIVVFPDVKMSHDRLINFKALLKVGLMKRKKLQDDLTLLSESIVPESVALLFPTDTDAGDVKEVSQGGILEALSAMSDKYSGLNGEDQSFSYLTDASPFAKLINYLTIYTANRAAVAESEKDFYQDIVEVMPTVLFGTKTGMENLYNNSVLQLNGRSPENKLKADLGSRVRFVFTDGVPGAEIERALRGAGISLFDLSELNDLTS